MRYSIIYLVLSVMVLQACTEPYIPKTENFEDLLVVEATITNELKAQKIRLTRTYSFNDLQTFPETGAEITVSDSEGNHFSFEYNAQDSTYYSIDEFQAMPGSDYSLSIITDNGNNYISSTQMLPPSNHVHLDIKRMEVDGILGVQIRANTYDSSHSSNYYRYEYQETHKIIPPYWSPEEAYIDEFGVAQHRFKQNPQADRICYFTENSNKIIIKSTAGLAEDGIENFPIRFLAENDYKLRYRYSILVKQYVETPEAYEFYESLQKISGDDENILSPSQPGFVVGNISSQNNSNQKVIGLFNVASVSSERIFLQHSVLFPDYPDPHYFEDCEIIKLDKTDLAPGGAQEGKRLLAMISQGTWFFYREEPANIFWMVQPVCTSCTTFASNEIPDFW
ncbi:MAG TPA: DUF4249 domain-containing protein [Flavobacteriaceae bacterium]|nr:DUF4249 domain-containing protein [Flavobacteriaceae bacterium]